MAQFKLCKSDSLLELIRDTFEATPIKVPETKIVPLSAIAKTRRTEKFLGRVENLLTETERYAGEIQESHMAAVSSKKSSSVDFNLGFQIMNGFLQGMGASGASIETKLKHVEKMSFSFQNVKRRWIDLGEFGNFLSNKKLNKKNPVNAQFFSEDAICVVIDSVIVSNNFTMNIEKASSGGIALDVEALNQTLANTDVSISSSSSSEISFNGKHQMAFAFSSTSFQVNDKGAISFLPANEGGIFKSAVRGEEMVETIYTPNRVMLYKDFGMIEFDDE